MPQYYQKMKAKRQHKDATKNFNYTNTGIATLDGQLK